MVVWALDRSVGRAGRGDGEAVLSALHGGVHTEVVASPPHGRRLLRHRLPAHGVHGAPGVPPQEARLAVRAQVSLLFYNQNIVQN